MGTGVGKEVFAAEDYARFRERLEWCLGVLAGLLERPGFGAGPTTIGAELELYLIDGEALPLWDNQAVRAAVADPRVNLELDQFNLELNATPVSLAGRPFAALRAELEELLGRVGAAVAAQVQGGRLALVGILPTLRRTDLQLDAISDAARYRALNHGLRRLRHDPFRIRIAGADRLDLAADAVTVEGAATSFQVHLRVDPDNFTRAYNAAQATSALVLAVAGNSPTFLGHRLWEETRVALCKQSVDDRDGRGPRRQVARMALGSGWLRGGPLAAFTESVRLYQPLLPVLSGNDPADDPGPGRRAPGLEELRLHQSTVWRWNRAIYDPAGGGHLRIELRALPAGPTIADMLANAALLIGLTRWLAGQDESWTRVLAFERADHGFYRAAQHGLAARLDWPFTPTGQLAPRTRTLPAATLVLELLPAAWEGLVSAGVASAEADELLGLIAARARTGQTGAAWQRHTLAVLEPRLGRERALAVMLECYLERAATGQPVHTWPSCT